jgi:hypothetical protein
MNNRMALISMIALVSVGCALDSTGGMVEKASSGDGGGVTTSTGGDCQSSGDVGSSNSASTSTSTSSSSNSSSDASSGDCVTGTGQGGDGGMGSSSNGSGGEAGATSSSSGEGGVGGGTGGAGGSGPTDCDAGTQDTPDTIDAWGNDETSMLLVKADDTTDYVSSEDGGEANKLTFDLNAGDKFPGTLMFYGLNGIHIRLKDGATPRPQDIFRLQGNISTIFETECEELQSEMCLVRLVQWWEECGSITPLPNGCPAIDALPQGTSDLYNLDLDGEWLMLIPIICNP